MDTRYILDKPLAGTRVAGADFNCRVPRSVPRSVLRDTRVEHSGPRPACTPAPVLYKLFLDGGSAAETKSGRNGAGVTGLPSEGRTPQDREKVRVLSTTSQRLAYCKSYFQAGSVFRRSPEKFDRRRNSSTAAIRAHVPVRSGSRLGRRFVKSMWLLILDMYEQSLLEGEGGGDGSN